MLCRAALSAFPLNWCASSLNAALSTKSASSESLPLPAVLQELE